MGQEGKLQRGLKNRHIQLIALGGAVGTGLFLGSGGAIQYAGPSIILCYMIAGFIAFCILRQLGEMITQEPIVGSFSNLAFKYWGDFPGFLSGWNYWILYILVGMSELTAVGVYIQYWFPQIETWMVIAFFFFLINAVNLFAVKVFGEFEFWFASIKIIAVIAMIIAGLIILFSTEKADGQSIFANLWIHGGFFPNGMTGFLFALAWVVFSFGGLELVGIAAAETENPQKVIPKAINQVLIRILIFYIGSLTILLMLFPWDQLNSMSGGSAIEVMQASPFVTIFDKLGIPVAAHILNFVILTAALSVYNNCAYTNARMLYGLALQKNAPAIFARTSKAGVPYPSLLLSSAITLSCVLINYLYPDQALGFLFALTIASLIINWAMITITQMFFRREKNKNNEKILFKTILYPWANYICLAFMALVLVLLYAMGKKIPVLIIPCWLVFVWLIYLLKEKINKSKV